MPLIFLCKSQLVCVKQNFRGSSGKNSMRVGPWGGLGGDPWDDGINSGVRQIIISHGAAIYSKQFEYDLRGSLVWSEKHGTSGGSSKTDQVRFASFLLLLGCCDIHRNISTIIYKIRWQYCQISTCTSLYSELCCCLDIWQWSKTFEVQTTSAICFVKQ
jgi:hypothetical protein